MGQVEDEIRVDAEDALAAFDGLETRRVFSGWGFYRHGLLFAAAWEGELRFRTRQGGRWIYEVAGRDLLDRPDELVMAARKVLERLEREPAARKPRSARTRLPGTTTDRKLGPPPPR